jgi:hypothetical protein
MPEISAALRNSLFYISVKNEGIEKQISLPSRLLDLIIEER